MKGVNFNEQLKVLFEKWTKESEFTHFFYDGLMNRGKIENPNWRSSGNEDELWNNAPKRIMFLLKDVNAGGDGPEDDDDIRGRNFKDTNSRTYLNMSYWLFGILKTIEMGEIPKYTFSNSESTQFFDDTPVAYVNCKKEAGKSSVSHNTLVNYIERDKKYIVEEIEILNPDIIVCCAWTEGSGNPIFDLVEKEIHKGIKKINGWMYYCEETNKLVINSYHPATTVCDDAYLFNEMMKAFKEFLDKYPNFIKSCRTIEYDDSYDTENEDCNNVTMQETNLCPNCKKEIEITLHSKYRQVKCEHCDSRFDSNMIETIEYIKARLDYRIRYFHEKDLKFVANKLWLSGAGSRDIDEILDDLENPEETPFAINKCDLEYMQNAKKSLIGWGWFLATHRLSSAYKKYRDNVLFEDSLPLLFHWLIWGVVATALAWILPANFWLSFILSFVACEVILLLFDYSKMSKKQKESMERLEECIYEEGENVSENIKNKNYEIIKNIEILIEKYDNKQKKIEKAEQKRKELEKKKREEQRQKAQKQKKEERIKAEERKHWLETPEGLVYQQEQEKIELEKERIKQEHDREQEKFEIEKQRLRQERREQDRLKKMKKCVWCGTEHSYSGRFCCKSCEVKFKNSR